MLQGQHNASKLARELGVTRFSVLRHRDKHLAPEGLKSRFDPSETESPGEGHFENENFPFGVLPLYRETPNGNRIESPKQKPPADPQTVKQQPPGDPQTAFLTSYAANGDVKEALKAGGATRAQLRKWQETDEAFSLRFHTAEAEAVEVLEAEARTRAVAGSKLTRRVFRHGVLYEEIHEWRPSDAMLTKLLQAAKPEKYGDKLTVTQTTVVKAIDSAAWDSV